VPKVHQDASLFVHCTHDVFKDMRAATKTVFDNHILDERPQKLFLRLRHVINNLVKTFEGTSHYGEVSGGKQMTGGQDKCQDLAQWKLAYCDYRVAEDFEPSLCSRKSEPHVGELVSVVVKLSDTYPEVFGDLCRGLFRLSPDFNHDAEKARKAVTLHKKTLGFKRFKVKAKN